MDFRAYFGGVQAISAPTRAGKPFWPPWEKAPLLHGAVRQSGSGPLPPTPAGVGSARELAGKTTRQHLASGRIGLVDVQELGNCCRQGACSGTSTRPAGSAARLVGGCRAKGARPHNRSIGKPRATGMLNRKRLFGPRRRGNRSQSDQIQPKSIYFGAFPGRFSDFPHIGITVQDFSAACYGRLFRGANPQTRRPADPQTRKHPLRSQSSPSFARRVERSSASTFTAAAIVTRSASVSLS